MYQTQRIFPTILMFAVGARIAVAYSGLVVVGTSIIRNPFDRSDHHLDLTSPSPTESAEKKAPEITLSSVNLPDSDKTISPSLLRYRQALNSGDDQGAAALLKHIKGIDLGYAARERDDNPTALRLWLREAERGNSEAQQRIADLYDQGATGVHQNDQLALKWYRRCAVRGNTSCQLRMAQIYAQGKVGAKQFGSAYMWLSVAMINATLQPNGSGALLRMFKDRETLSRQMSSLEVVKAQHLASHCYSSNYRHCGT